MEKRIEIKNKLKERIESIDLLEKARERSQDFIRSRKVGFVSLMILIMSLLRKTLQLELDEFIRKETLEKNETYTKQSFSEARQKIKPEVFNILNRELIEMYYTQGYKDYKGYRILAIDGSKIQLPNNKKTREYYGSIRNNSEHFEIAQALSSNLYDVENRIIISSLIAHCESSERKLAEQNIRELIELRQETIQNLILFDRGYPSFELIKFIENTGQKYIMRVKSNFFKEVIESEKKDEIVTVIITPSRQKHMKQQGYNAQLGDSITMRVVKFNLPSGEEEILITNVICTDISLEECKILYFKRWGIETKYDVLKNKMQIENFSGDSLKVIQQDFYATVFLANIAVLVEEDAVKIYESKDNSQKNMITA
jgi:predicted mannosyl-3-phosphoglycerate phosphatase (HAD superfamily)